MFATVPVNVIAASEVPSPAENASPAVPASVSVPFVEFNETCTADVPASRSPIEIEFPAAVEKMRVVSSAVV